MLTTAALFSYLSEQTNLTAAQIWFSPQILTVNTDNMTVCMLHISVSIFTAAAISDLLLDCTSPDVIGGWGGLTTE